MNEFAERIERDFPVRRKEKEKVDFRTWLVYTLKELGYSPKLESGTSALSAGGNVTNVVVGDIEKAKIVLAAHYDTAVREVLAAAHLPDATGDVHALRGADAAAGAGGELPYFVRRDVRAQHAEYDAAALFVAAGRDALLPQIWQE